MSDGLSVILAWLIILFGACIAFLNFRFYRRCNRPWRWVKLLYGVVGLMYSGFYLLYMLQVIPAAMPYTRAMTTVTLAVLLSGSIVSERSRIGRCHDLS
jgi:hypothetical protein